MGEGAGVAPPRLPELAVFSTMSKVFRRCVKASTLRDFELVLGDFDEPNEDLDAFDLDKLLMSPSSPDVWKDRGGETSSMDWCILWISFLILVFISLVSYKGKNNVL